ncbi:hypothetical protein PUN28_013984 [Cardiocondyla obscurior]|uniref:Uncharacterized protein n=1 Tax=Cardiocondyla obscurior TaxID=286306 RepID=A0AAW2F769_9HYME
MENVKIVVGEIELEKVQLQREVRVVIPPQSFDIREAIFRGKIINGYRMDHMRYEEIRKAHGLEPMWNVFKDDFKAAIGEIVPKFAQEEDDEDEGEEEVENVNLM